MRSKKGERLLRQPGGFEGFGLASKGLPPGGLAVPRLACQPHRFIEGHTAIAAVAAHAQGGDHRVPEVARFEDLDLEVGEDSEHASPKFADAVVTAQVRTAL